MTSVSVTHTKTSRFITASTTLWHWTMNQMNPVHILTLHIFNNSFKITLPPIPRSSKRLPLWVFWLKFCMHFWSVPCMLYAHFQWLDRPCSGTAILAATENLRTSVFSNLNVSIFCRQMWSSERFTSVYHFKYLLYSMSPNESFKKVLSKFPVPGRITLICQIWNSHGSKYQTYVLWDIMPCSLMDGIQHFWGT
jgi:hypothetical protein